MPIVNSEVRFSVGTQQHYDSPSISNIYPIGIVITFYDNDDPSNFLGLTWQRCLQERSPIGVDSSDTIEITDQLTIIYNRQK